MIKRAILTGILFAALLCSGAAAVSGTQEYRAESGRSLPADTPATGIGRAAGVEIYLAGAEAEEVSPRAISGDAGSVEIYIPGEGEAPEWYRPDEPMAAEWVEVPAGQSRSATDIGCPDWNLATSFVGWDGRRLEAWEMDLYARIVYLEFWGTSPECMEAGADSILRLWESGLFGSAIGETLSGVTETGAWAYSTYPSVWVTDYDADGLALCRSVCEARFLSGPVWIAPFFQLGGYPEWAIPCYEMDGVYFSTAEEFLP